MGNSGCKLEVLDLVIGNPGCKLDVFVMENPRCNKYKVRGRIRDRDGKIKDESHL